MVKPEHPDEAQFLLLDNRKLIRCYLYVVKLKTSSSDISMKISGVGVSHNFLKLNFIKKRTFQQLYGKYSNVLNV